MYIIILTFYATAGMTTPSSFQKQIPAITFESRLSCENFGKRVRLAESGTRLTYNCVLVENK